MDLEEILKKALEMEKDAIKVYNELKSSTSDPETIDLLSFLISQEKEHINLITSRLKAIRLLKK